MQVEQVFNRQRKVITSKVPHDRAQPWRAHSSLRSEKYTGHRTDNRWVTEWCPACVSLLQVTDLQYTLPLKSVLILFCRGACLMLSLPFMVSGQNSVYNSHLFCKCCMPPRLPSAFLFDVGLQCKFLTLRSLRVTLLALLSLGVTFTAPSAQTPCFYARAESLALPPPLR